jgi:hypothetical protein
MGEGGRRIQNEPPHTKPKVSPILALPSVGVEGTESGGKLPTIRRPFSPGLLPSPWNQTTSVAELLKPHAHTGSQEADARWGVLVKPWRTVSPGTNEMRLLALMDERYLDRSRGRLR